MKKKRCGVPWANHEYWSEIDLSGVPTPCYVVDINRLWMNLKIIKSISKAARCTILMALKGFAMWGILPIRGYKFSAAASSLHEAQLGFEEYYRKVHLFSPAYKPEEMPKLLECCSHITFNSFSQWERYKYVMSDYIRDIKCGIRVNPERRETKTQMYDPCGNFSRLGVTKAQFRPDELDGISGLHMHNLCEKNADAFIRTLAVFEKNFGEFLPRMEWVNFGGGHLITNPAYKVDLLVKTIKDFRQRHPHLQVFLEPGEAFGLNTGVLVASVLDIVHNRKNIAILDTSAAAHMPDVLEMPYRPEILGAGQPGEFPYSYRLGGNSCLAGDIIGDYTFPEPLQIGDKIVLLDMAHYTMVKNTTFNGINLPSIAIRVLGGEIDIIKTFGYEDYKNRLS